MNKRIIFSILAGLILLVFSCKYDKADLVYPQHNPPPCDTTDVKLSVQLHHILTTNCFSCHSGTAVNGAGIRLDNYNTLKSVALGGMLMPAITHTGTSPMPKNAPKLTDCEINMFQAWINEGAPNN